MMKFWMILEHYHLLFDYKNDTVEFLTASSRTTVIP